MCYFQMVCIQLELVYSYHKFSIKSRRGLIVFKHFRGGLIGEGSLNKFLKYEQIFYGEIICIFQESASITISSSSVIIICLQHIDV